MRKIVFASLLLICAVYANAYNMQGDLNFMKKQSKLHLIADFSHTQILGVEGAQLSEWKATLGEDSTLYIKRFYNGVVDGLENRFLLVGDQPNAEYKVLMTIEQVDTKGTVYATFVFTPMNDDNNILCTLQMVGKGGHIGTFLNLFCDGMRSLGEDFGELLRKKTKSK